MFGNDLQTYDLDVIEVESHSDEPYQANIMGEFNYKAECFGALELKHGNQREIKPDSHQLKCLSNMLNPTIPFFLVYYYCLDANNKLVNAGEDEKSIVHWQFKVVPINQSAKDFRNAVKVWPEVITELQYCYFLSKLRGKNFDKNLSNFPESFPLCDKLLARLT